MDEPTLWWRIADSSSALPEGARLHTCIAGRFISVFRAKGELSAMDSVCYHAGGPLTLGEVRDIEELGATVVSCPWHKINVDIATGFSAYQAVEVIDGKPTKTGWKLGSKAVQRVHSVREGEDGCLEVALNTSSEACRSDADASNVRCGEAFALHPFPPTSVAADV